MWNHIKILLFELLEKIIFAIITLKTFFKDFFRNIHILNLFRKFLCKI